MNIEYVSKKLIGKTAFNRRGAEDVKARENINVIVSRILNCEQELDLSNFDFSFMDEASVNKILEAFEVRATKESATAIKKLQLVDLSHCKIQGTNRSLFCSEQVNILASLLVSLRKFQITSLNLSHGTLNSLAQNETQRSLILLPLAQLTFLTMLDISYNNLHEVYGWYPKEQQIESGHAIFLAIKDIKLRSLKIQGVRCGHNSTQYDARLIWARLIESILENHPTLVELDLSNSDFVIHKEKLQQLPEFALRVPSRPFTLILTEAKLYTRPTNCFSFLYSYNCLKYLSLINAKLVIEESVLQNHFNIVFEKLNAGIYAYEEGYFIFDVEHIKWNGGYSHQSIDARFALTTYKAANKFLLADNPTYKAITECAIKKLGLLPHDLRLPLLEDCFDEQFINLALGEIPIEMVSKVDQWKINRAARVCIVIIQAMTSDKNANNLLRTLSPDILLHIFSYLIPPTMQSINKTNFYNNLTQACIQPSQFFTQRGKATEGSSTSLSPPRVV